MSAIGGIYNFDGGPVDHAAILSLDHGLKTRAPDGGTQVHNGPLAMAIEFQGDDARRVEFLRAPEA